MKYLKTYLQKIISYGNNDLAESIASTSQEIGNKHIQNFNFTSHEIGLLFGNIQSGKTAHMFGIICKAADLGFPAFILLTTDNITLQQQTLQRAKTDLDGFCICGENDSNIFVNNSLVQPIIIVLKKNIKVLKLWSNILNSTGFMKGNPLFIVDDEADSASLNTMINQNKISSINRYLNSIKDRSSSSLYIQVTGTPQAILLQTLNSGWHPFFKYYFRPGKEYLGGDFFFHNTEKPDCIELLDSITNPVRNVVIRHILVSSQIFSTNGNVSNCLIHPSVRQIAHQHFADKIVSELDWCKVNITTDFVEALKRQYISLSPVKSPRQEFSILLKIAQDLLLNKKVNILIMNAISNDNSLSYTYGCNIIIGGNTLGRGITFPKLHTIYYTRTSKKPQADTMWQHSRMFGYDRDPGLMKVYIENNLYKLFSDINATNNSIIAQIENEIESLKIYYPLGINPTRKNVIEINHINIIAGGINFFPVNPENNTISDISALLEPFSDEVSYYQVNLRLINKILTHIVPSADFKLLAYQSVINTILAQESISQGILIVRRNRNVTKGTGSLLSPNDWKQGAKFTDKIVLTMYQVIGIKGWLGVPIWIPNIKLPHGIIYFDVT